MSVTSGLPTLHEPEGLLPTFRLPSFQAPSFQFPTLHVPRLPRPTLTSLLAPFRKHALFRGTSGFAPSPLPSLWSSPSSKTHAPSGAKASILLHSVGKSSLLRKKVNELLRGLPAMFMMALCVLWVCNSLLADAAALSRIDAGKDGAQVWYLQSSWGRGNQTGARFFPLHLPRREVDLDLVSDSELEGEWEGSSKDIVEDVDESDEATITPRMVWVAEMKKIREKERERSAAERAKKKEKMEKWQRDYNRMQSKRGRDWEEKKYLEAKTKELRQKEQRLLAEVGKFVHDGHGNHIEDLPVVKFHGRVDGSPPSKEKSKDKPVSKTGNRMVDQILNKAVPVRHGDTDRQEEEDPSSDSSDGESSDDESDWDSDNDSDGDRDSDDKEVTLPEAFQTIMDEFDAMIRQTETRNGTIADALTSFMLAADSDSDSEAAQEADEMTKSAVAQHFASLFLPGHVSAEEDEAAEEAEAAARAAALHKYSAALDRDSDSDAESPSYSTEDGEDLVISAITASDWWAVNNEMRKGISNKTIDLLVEGDYTKPQEKHWWSADGKVKQVLKREREHRQKVRERKAEKAKKVKAGREGEKIPEIEFDATYVPRAGEEMLKALVCRYLLMGGKWEGIMAPNGLRPGQQGLPVGISAVIQKLNKQGVLKKWLSTTCPKLVPK